MSTNNSHDILVGTFGTPYLFSLRFTPPSSDNPTASLKIIKQHAAVGSHSWLHLNPPNKSGIRNLYATAWLEPPSIAAYAVHDSSNIELLNTAPTNSRSGYVCASMTHAYSAGGATGEVFALDQQTGAFTSGTSTTDGAGEKNTISPVQKLDFIDTTAQRDDGSTMDFGGLRHGAHSADLSPDGSLLYIADIGRNCIWMYSIESGNEHMQLVEKKISPRKHDGPRHVWPHPGGKYVYSLQEHSSVVDVFEVVKSGDSDVRLVHKQGVRIIPRGLPVNEFWADEVRTSLSNGGQPKYLYASTRGLKEGRKGYVAVYALTPEGLVDGAELVTAQTAGKQEHEDDDGWRDDDQAGLLCMYETVTSGGWANAIQPGVAVGGVEYIAMTDSEEGYVFVLSWDGKEIREAARVSLNEGVDTSKGKNGAATAVWL